MILLCTQVESFWQHRGKYLYLRKVGLLTSTNGYDNDLYKETMYNERERNRHVIKSLITKTIKIKISKYGDNSTKHISFTTNVFSLERLKIRTKPLASSSYHALCSCASPLHGAIGVAGICVVSCLNQGRLRMRSIHHARTEESISPARLLGCTRV